MICIHCNHVFVGNAFIRGSGPGTSVAMRRCPKCNKEFVAPPKLRAPGKVVALQAEIDALRATVERLRDALELIAGCEEIVAAEREACAKLCEEFDAENPYIGQSRACAFEIRARGEK